MGFTTGTFPPVEPAEFLERPLMERMKVLALHWVDHGFGTPKLIPTTYVVKLVVLYLGLGSFLITSTSGLGPVWDVGSWWAEPIVYQKAIAWTMFLETLGLAG